MATRVGGYCWEINMEEMDMEELTALRNLCDYYLKIKQRYKLEDELKQLLEKINDHGLKAMLINNNFLDIEITPDVCFLETK